MVCKKCNAELPSGASFCVNCGTKVELVSEQEETIAGNTFCSNCGKELEQGSKFCPVCGTTMQQGNISPNEGYETRQQITPPNVMYGAEQLKFQTNAGIQGNNLEYQMMNIKTTKRWLKYGIIFLLVLTIFSAALPAVQLRVGVLGGLLGGYTEETSKTYTLIEVATGNQPGEGGFGYALYLFSLLAFFLSGIAAFLEVFMFPLINAVVHLFSCIILLASYEDLLIKYRDTNLISAETCFGAYVPIVLSMIIILLAIYAKVLQKREKYISYMQQQATSTASSAEEREQELLDQKEKEKKELKKKMAILVGIPILLIIIIIGRFY